MDSSSWSLPPVSAATAPVSVACASGGVAVPVVEWATPGLPVVLPLAALPLAARLGFARQEGLLPLDQRVALLLAGDQRAAAFALALRAPLPLGAQGRLEIELATWATAERIRLRLPASRGPVLVVEDDVRGTTTAEIRGALHEVGDLLSPLPWPRWAGPVVVYLDAVDRGIPTDGVVRPALPLIRLTPGPQLRGDAAGVLARLALDLSVPPAGGWPGWLRVGVGEAARAVAVGEGLSPRAMAARRSAAGPDGLRALFASPTPDPQLAKAVVAELLVPARRPGFASFLDLLRQGASSEGALRVAYGLEPGGW